MRGDFENIWKDAFDDASITPSEKVWNEIAGKMDSGSGRRSWVTILLIAATVTMAFAFPLTVGNAEYDFKPQTIELTETNSPDNAASENFTAEQKGPIGITEKQENEDLVALDRNDSQLAQINSLAGGNAAQVADEPVVMLIEAETQGIYTYQELQDEPGLLLDEYYILPAYKYASDFDNRSLLAYGNINSGRQSSISGLNSMEFLNAASDFEKAPGLSNSADYANRSEDGGATFYVGVGAELPVSRRINLSFGLGYQNQRLNGSSNTIYEENGQQYPVGIYDPILPGTVFLSESYEYVSNNQFVSVPLGAKYALVDKRVKLRLGLGLSPDFMLAHKVTAAEYGSRSTQVSETAYKPIQLTALLNLDVLLPLRANYGLALETGLRQGMVPYVENGSAYTTSFNFGVILFYQIKK